MDSLIFITQAHMLHYFIFVQLSLFIIDEEQMREWCFFSKIDEIVNFLTFFR